MREVKGWCSGAEDGLMTRGIKGSRRCKGGRLITVTHLACFFLQLPSLLKDVFLVTVDLESVVVVVDAGSLKRPCFRGEAAESGQTGGGISARGVLSPLEGAVLVVDPEGEDPLF